MTNKETRKNVMSLADIAEVLGLSKSTISRVIAGKGNFSEKTRAKVLKYIENHDYHPNVIAQRLATSRTGNIGVVIPADAFLTVNTFFQVCLIGICQEAAEHNYDIIVTSATEKDCSYLRRLISRRSVDGIILMRSVTEDICMNYLIKTGVPFVVIGSTSDPNVMQIDVAHAKACEELTARLLETTEKLTGFILGSTNHIVNLNRQKGFEQAVLKSDIRPTERVISDVFTNESIYEAVDRFTAKGVGTIVCGDDQICLTALARLDELRVSVGKDVRVAAFYDSPALKNRSITAIEVNDMALGALAVEKLVSRLDGKRISERTPGYFINYRASTGDIKG